MQRHWAAFGPPAYVAAALYLGLYRPQSLARERIEDPDNLAAMLSGFPGAVRQNL